MDALADSLVHVLIVHRVRLSRDDLRPCDLLFGHCAVLITLNKMPYFFIKHFD